MIAYRPYAFVPIRSPQLPRPLRRFGAAFPLAVAEHYLSLHVPPGGTVADPLAYPFSAADAAERSGRRAVGASEDSLAEWARRTVRGAPREAEALAALERVGDSVRAGGVPHRAAMRELYTGKCGTCHAPVVIEALIWERDVRARTRRAYRCGVCARDGRSLLFETTADDRQPFPIADAPGPGFQALVDRFGEDRRLGERVAMLYTPRNLQALMATVDAVDSAAEGPARALLRLALVEVIVCGSADGAPLVIERGRPHRGPRTRRRREVNVWLEYERTVRDLAAWLEADGPARARRNAAAGTAAEVRADLVLFAGPTEDLLGDWADVASVICLGARPRAQARPTPRSDPAGERSTRHVPGIEEARTAPSEVAVGAGVSPGRGNAGTRDALLSTVRAALAEGRARSREGAPAAVYVAPAETAALAACALAAAGAGYELDGIGYQPDALDPAQGSGNASAAILSFRPVASEAGPAFVDRQAVRDAMHKGIAAAIAARGEPVGPDRAGVAALEVLGSEGILPGLLSDEGVSPVERFIAHLADALDVPGRSGLRRVGEDGRVAYALPDPDAEADPLDDRVEWAVWGLLSAAQDDDTPGFLRRAYAMFPGVLTPERDLVERCLASYGVRGGDGRWELRPEDAQGRRRVGRAAVVAGLADAGARLGFEVAVGREFAGRPPPSPSGGARPLAVVGRPDPAALGRVIEAPPVVAEALDCVWYGRGGLVFVWQVEWTARLNRSIAMLGEAIRDDSRTFRFLVVADLRHDLLAYKLHRSRRLKELVARRAWRFVGWEAIRRLAGSSCASLADLEPILGLRTAWEQPRHQTVFHW